MLGLLPRRKRWVWSKGRGLAATGTVFAENGVCQAVMYAVGVGGWDGGVSAAGPEGIEGFVMLSN